MSLMYTYKPVLFFLITLVGTWFFWFIAAYLSTQLGFEKWQTLLILAGLMVPCIVALAMIYGSSNSGLMRSFLERLFLFKMDLRSLAIIAAIPIAFFLATALSLIFGKSTEQFTLAGEFQVMKGWQILSLVMPLLLAPALEELGWRGYGVDSLRANLNLFSTSMLFAFLWGVWHLPLFFVQGYYHHQLWNLNVVYVANFFISMIPASILINWVYFKNGRSILIAIVVHAVLNASSILFKTEQFTKCIATLLLSLVAFALIALEKDAFFSK